MGRGWEAAAEASFTAAWCCTTQRKLGKTAIDDAPAHRGSKAHRGREVVKQPNWLPLQSASFLSKAACRQQHCRKSDGKIGIVAISLISLLIASWHFIHFYIRLYILLEGSLQVASQ